MQADKLIDTEVSTAYSFTFSPSISSSTEQNKSLATNTSVSCSTKFEALALRDQAGRGQNCFRIKAIYVMQINSYNLLRTDGELESDAKNKTAHESDT